jgi:tetratricopeptide (TPR) repeat protein
MGTVDPENLMQSAIEHAQDGDLAIALLQFEQALKVDPNDARLLCNYGNVLADLNRASDAIDAYDLALNIRPDYAIALSNKAVVLIAENRFEEAIACCDVVLTIEPSQAAATSNREIALQNLKRIAAQEHFDQAIEYQFSSRYEDACTSYEAALQIVPEFAPANWNASQCYLKLGNLKKGWELAEHRWQIDQFRPAHRVYPQPLWLGKESLRDKTILLWQEQGIGDTLQFCRYVKAVENLGAKVILEADEKLLPLFESSLSESLSTILYVSPKDTLPSFDFHAPLMSLPLACGTHHIADIPAVIPYLFADTKAIERNWIPELDKRKLKVGLIWAGNNINGVDPERSLPLLAFEPLAGIDPDQVQFVSLQIGIAAEQLQHLINLGWAGPAILDVSEKIRDWGDTAAIIEQLDVVVCCDTSVAHLSGAMGKPTWILSRFRGCWRWLQGRDDSPWYPTVRLFHQSIAGDWQDVIENVVAALNQQIEIKNLRS